MLWNEFFDGTLSHILEQPLTEAHRTQLVEAMLGLLGLLQKYKLIHGDFHDENIAYRFVTDADGFLRIQLLLIDFGFSDTGRSNELLEVLQITRMLVDPELNFDPLILKALLAAFKPILAKYKVRDLDYDHLTDRYLDYRKKLGLG